MRALFRCQERVNHNARGVLDEMPPERWQMMADGEDVGGCYRKGSQQHRPHHAADQCKKKIQCQLKSMIER